MQSGRTSHQWQRRHYLVIVRRALPHFRSWPAGNLAVAPLRVRRGVGLKIGEALMDFPPSYAPLRIGITLVDPTAGSR